MPPGSHGTAYSLNVFMSFCMQSTHFALVSLYCQPRLFMWSITTSYSGEWRLLELREQLTHRWNLAVAQLPELLVVQDLVVEGPVFGRVTEELCVDVHKLGKRQQRAKDHTIVLGFHFLWRRSPNKNIARRLFACQKRNYLKADTFCTSPFLRLS